MSWRLAKGKWIARRRKEREGPRRREKKRGRGGTIIEGEADLESE
jgi:hypothetical protein